MTSCIRSDSKTDESFLIGIAVAACAERRCITKVRNMSLAWSAGEKLSVLHQHREDVLHVRIPVEVASTSTQRNEADKTRPHEDL